MARLAYFLLFTIMLFSAQWVYAVPVDTFTFQGLLKDNNGVLVTGKKDITLRLYTIPSGGSASSDPGASCPKAVAPFCVWQENQTSIDVTNGIFTIFAGNTTSLNRVDFTKALYLEVIIRSGLVDPRTANDQVLTPRINITGSPFALSTERGQFGYFNGTQFLINQTSTTSKITHVNITSLGLGTALQIKSGATFNNIINVTAFALTTGSALNITSTSGSDLNRNLVVINQNSTAADSAIALKINQAGSAAALNIETSTTGTANSGAVNITAGSLTFGPALSVTSASSSIQPRSLVEINQNSTAADSAIALKINQGGTDLAVEIKASTTDVGAVNITAGRLTTGSALSVASNSGSIANRNLVDINQNSTSANAATALRINQAGSIAPALAIKSLTTTGNVINVTAGAPVKGTVLNIKTGATLGNVINITAGSLVTGSIINVTSGSGSDANRNLVSINQNSTGADFAVPLRINQGGTAPAVIIKSGSTGAGIATTGAVNITAGSLTAAKSSALVVGSTSGTVAGAGKANERYLVNITSTNNAATNTVALNVLSTAPSSTIIRANNGTGTVMNVTTSGLVQVSNLQVNASAGTTELFGIYSGTNTTAIRMGQNSITVTGASSGDVAACSFQGGTFAASASRNVAVLILNVTTNTVSVNVTSNTFTGTAPAKLTCLVFDLTDGLGPN